MNIVLSTDKVLARLVASKRVFSVTFILAFFEQSISPIMPDAYLVLVLAYRKDISWKKLSFVSALGSACGGVFTYFLGFFFYKEYGSRIIDAFGWGGVVEQARSLFAGNVYWAQFMAAVTPLPDRVFSFVAGAFSVNLFAVFIMLFLGRILRALFVGYMAYEWGDEVRLYIKKHTRTAIITAIIGALLFGVYHYLLS